MPRLSFIYPEALLWLLLIVPLWALALLTPRRMGAFRFWSSLGLRSALILALVLGLAGTQIVRPVEDITTVFLIDSSDSVSPSARSQAEQFVNNALKAMRTEDRAAVVVFGENALVDRAPSNLQNLGRLSSAPIASRTNIEQAIQLGLALFPADTQKRLVLISDGGENDGKALEAVRLAATNNIPIDIVNLSNPSDDEVLISELRAPSQVRAGQQFQLETTVESSVDQDAILRIFQDQTLIREDSVQLKEGINTFQLPITADQQGFQRFRAQIEPLRDGRVQNNEASTIVRFQGPPQVLLVASAPDEAANLEAALQAANVNASTVSPIAMPTELASMSSYDAIVLVNVRARDLPERAMVNLPIYVRDLGKGLLMIGGRSSFGVGGYSRSPIEEALPVYMDVRNREERPNLALVFIIDKSGSMDACHCSGPDRQTAQFQEGGEAKVNIAKEAVVQASVLLSSKDSLGVVAFDEAAHWALPSQNVPNAEEVTEALSSVQPQGNTNVRAGMLAAEEQLKQSDARIKHAILLTDGWSGGGDNLDIAQRMQDEGITLSVVAAGSGSADYLERLAEFGGGRYYPAEHMDEVPEIFVQETITAVGNYIIEEAFTPIRTADSPILNGIAGLPPLYGYNGSTLKESARAILVSNDMSPVLAQWQYGLGRSVAWLSDTKGQWGRDWVRWDEFPLFSAQLVGWVLPSDSNRQISSDIRVDGTQTSMTVQVQNESGQAQEGLELVATIINNRGEQQEVTLRQVAPGEYHTNITSPLPGTYLVQIAGSQAGRAVFQDLSGFVVPYSPEYRQNQGNPALLSELAKVSNGRVLDNPADAFSHDLAAVRRAQEITWPLLILALLILPFDIAVRRLLIRNRDLKGIAGNLTPAKTEKPDPVPDERLARLSAAKQRVNNRSQAQAPAAEAQAEAKAKPSPAPSSPETAQPSQEDSLARLREARDRARRRARGEE
jgi:uncharacterized membrane protein/secreted protein with Ig-like and vWFA domain